MITISIGGIFALFLLWLVVGMFIGVVIALIPHYLKRK